MAILLSGTAGNTSEDVLQDFQGWGFENGLSGWKSVGKAFKSGPVTGKFVRAGDVLDLKVGGDYWWDLEYPIGNEGEGWIGSLKPLQNLNLKKLLVFDDRIMGSLISPAFVAERPILSFLIAGGDNLGACRLELLEKGSGPEGLKMEDGSYRPVEPKSDFRSTGSGKDVFAQESWDISALKGKTLRLRLLDNSVSQHISLDDVRFHDSLGGSHNANAPLWGYADMHTHPMAHLGYGRKVLHGEPDGPLDKALGDCDCTHGAWGIQNPCGNLIRAQVIASMEEYHEGSPHGHGYDSNPKKSLRNWPVFNSISHQQMRHEWLRRTWEGGLRVMVALAVNSELLAEAVQGEEPDDDKTVADQQIAYMKSFVERHDFMEIAYSSADLRDIVGRNKLAIVLGLEVDNIGNFNTEDTLSSEMVVAEIERLETQGVRYIIPIHLVDNQFGGTAIMMDLFNIANKYATGQAYAVEAAPESECIDFELSAKQPLMMSAVRINNPDIPANVLPLPGNYPKYIPSASGHRNTKGLTEMGRVAIRAMMHRGMLIDIDHMSMKSANECLQIAQKTPGAYPMNSGHNGFRCETGRATENQRSPQQLQIIRELGGLMGVGCAMATSGNVMDFEDVVDSGSRRHTVSKVDNNCAGSSRSFAQNYLYALERMAGRNVCIGSDANGAVALPSPRFGPAACWQNRADAAEHRMDVSGQSPDTRIQYQTEDGGKNAIMKACNLDGRTWDYNVEGMAHYGMFPDFFQELHNVGLEAQDLSPFFRSAEYFAQMWEKCERIAAGLRE